MMSLRPQLIVLSTFAALLPSMATAEAYRGKPVCLVVPFASGGVV